MNIFRDVNFIRDLLSHKTWSTGPTANDFAEAGILADELRRQLPREFVLSGKKFPDLHFIADDDVPGLFRAKVQASSFQTQDERKG